MSSRATVDTPEWAALELVLRMDLGLPASGDLERLVGAESFDWGELLEQALRHKLLPLAASYLTVDPVRSTIPWHVRGHLDRVLALNRYTLGVYRATAADIVRALDGAGVRFVATKGIVFESTLYGANGTRYMNDLDVMILPAQRADAVAALSEIGFRPGVYYPPSAEIQPHPRRETVTYRLNPDHVPLLVRLTGDPVAPATLLDVAYSLTWARSEYEVRVEDALATIATQPLPGHADVALPTFVPYYQFVFTALHLFREAWIDRWLAEDQDVNLAKFADVLRLWQRDGESLLANDLRDRLDEDGIVQPVAWVLTHLDDLMGTEIAAAVGIHGSITESWLSSAYAPGGGIRHWQGPIRERLRSKQRHALFDHAEPRRRV
jgi:hypothetical protein